MAIKCEIQTPSGIHVNYHRIIAVNINWMTKRMTISIASYLSEYMRRHNKEPVESNDINIEYDFPITLSGESLLTMLYNWLKENAVGFESAEDC